MTKRFSPELIAPCGMNCQICYAFLRKKNTCPGCREFCAQEPVSIARCAIRNCPSIKAGTISYCISCEKFPCAPLKRLDKRYRTKYHMSEIANLECVRDQGIDALLEKEKAAWTCPVCNGIIVVHTQMCSVCNRAL